MNTQPNPAEDPLEVLLHKNHAPLADAGFTARVLAALPPPAPKPHRFPSRRTIVCTLGALIGFGLALARSGLPRTSDFTAFSYLLQSSVVCTAASLSDPTVLTLGGLTLATLVFAYSREIIAKLD